MNNLAAQRMRILLTVMALVAIWTAPTAHGAVRTVSGGIEFTYFAPGAGAVFLAGSFNGWNATQLPLKDDGKGNWSIVHALGPGKHEYKFVVDGAWFADPENPNTVADPYGGTNSLVELGSDGKIAEGAENRPISNTTLNARLYLSGRYLTRYIFEKNQPFTILTNPEAPADQWIYETDKEPRFRLQRPVQSVDLNFHAAASDLVDSYTRLRLDNRENIIQDNISAFLDEASVEVHPSQFRVLGYWDMEVFTLGDPLGLGGDVDLPGTIMDDHLNSGKGTSGGMFTADPKGVHVQAYFANIYNGDIYNDPDLFDNTGQDLFGLRLSRRIGQFEFGLPAYLQHSLVWMDFGGVVGQTDTGIPHLTEYLERTGDPSTWFEFEDRYYRYGLDVTRRFWNDRAVVSLEWLYGDRRQGLVTGNDSGPNNENGAIDVELLTRAQTTWHGSCDLDLGAATHLNVEHTSIDMGGTQGDETELAIHFLPENIANRQIYFGVGGSPPQTTQQYSEATLTWEGDGRSHAVWLQRANVDFDLAAIGAVTTWDSTASSTGQTAWTLSGRQSLGKPDGETGCWELESAFTWIDFQHYPLEWTSYEFILRNEKQLARKLSLLADIRFIYYDVSLPENADESQFGLAPIAKGFWAPYAGLKYQPNAKVEVVVAYGVDPLDFAIDYNGRQTGRWWYRQMYLFEHPDQSIIDAERSLDEARIFGARIIFQF
jgi:hypothetical protein